jgi:hypothetical protein
MQKGLNFGKPRRGVQGNKIVDGPARVTADHDESSIQNRFVIQFEIIDTENSREKEE